MLTLPTRIPTWQDLSGNPRLVRHFLNLWPPFAFAGIRVEHVSDDFRHVRVRLGFHLLTRNYVGTQFGGSMFSMTDPFWMVMLLRALGERDHIVWDRAGEIDFVAPGKGPLTADFVLTDEVVEEVRAAAAETGKTLRWFETEVVDQDGAVVARVRKQLYIRTKASRRRRSAVSEG